MPTFTVFDGVRKRRAVGRHQAEIARFAYDHPNLWHLAARDSASRRAIRALERRRFLKTRRDRGLLLYRYRPSRAECGYSIKP
ncbi:MAG TPA: hypothetical protein VF292_07410 [Rhodanobacteraceae bacterium]